MSRFAQVWPKTSPTPGAEQAPASGSTIPTALKNPKVLGIAGAAVVVVVALIAARKNSTDTEDTDGTGDPYTIDTTETDLYNELQPELENIGDALEQLGDKWPPGTKTPQTPHNPHGHGQSPHPAWPDSVGNQHTYKVKAGDTLKEIAKHFKVPGGATVLYARNRDAIVKAAREHKNPNPLSTRKLYPGTVLRIPQRKKK